MAPNRNLLAGARLALITLALLGLGACETLPTTPEDEGGEAQVEERGVERGAAGTEGEEAASTRGMRAPGAFQGHPLDNPEGPLSQRLVYFDFDSSEIREDYRPMVEAHAAYLADHPEASVTLEGHTDERGTREYNLALGERRCESVQRMMVLLGAQPEQIQTVSYGEERPAADGHDESAWSQNRRVEIVYRTR